MKSPLVTVVVAVLNRVETIERCIQSVVSQDSKHIDLVLIDGVSTDGTLEVIEKYLHKISYFVSEKDQGIYSALNKGVAAAKGEWILIIGSDDYLADLSVISRVEPMLAAAKEANARIAYGNASMFDPSDPTRMLITRGEPWEKAKKKMSGSLEIPHPGAFQNRIVFENGGFDESYKVAADYKLLLSECTKAAPYYLDTLIACASLGGVSSNPKNAMAITKEMIRARWEVGLWPLTHQLFLNLVKLTAKSFF